MGTRRVVNPPLSSPLSLSSSSTARTPGTTMPFAADKISHRQPSPPLTSGSGPMLMEPRGKRKWRTVERKQGQRLSLLIGSGKCLPRLVNSVLFLLRGQSRHLQATSFHTLCPVEATHNSSPCGLPSSRCAPSSSSGSSISPHHPLADRHSSAVTGAEAQEAAAAVYIPVSRFCHQVAHHLAASRRGSLRCCWRS